MTIRAEPMTGNKITVDENGRITFRGWKVTHDQPLTNWDQMGFAVLDYLRERLAALEIAEHEQHHCADERA